MLSRPQRKLWLSHRDFYCWLQVGAGDILSDDLDLDIDIYVDVDIDIDIDTWNVDTSWHQKFQKIVILGDACHQERERHRI